MEFKCNVYDKINDKMYSTEEYDIVLELNNEMVRINGCPYDYEEEIEVVILPSTGVKDINIKESYLGDILKEPIYEFESKTTKDKKKETFGVVKKKNDSNNLYLEWNFSKMFEGEKCWLTNELPITHIDRYEIVGNVFENEELIEK